MENTIAQAKAKAAEVVEAFTFNKSAHIETEALKALALLRDEDPAEWQRVRDELKKRKVRVSELERVIQIVTPPRFVVKDGVICEIKFTGVEKKYVALCNFNAWIVRGECHDDGLDREMFCVIAGELADGEPLPEVCIPAGTYESMRWVRKYWAPRAYIMPGRGIRDRLRFAIQVLSGKPPIETIYTAMQEN